MLIALNVKTKKNLLRQGCDVHFHTSTIRVALHKHCLLLICFPYCNLHFFLTLIYVSIFGGVDLIICFWPLKNHEFGSFSKESSNGAPKHFKFKV